MKITIDFPNNLLHRAKVMAAKRLTTLREPVVKGLERVTPESSDESAQKRSKEDFRMLVASHACIEHGTHGPPDA